jgi:hypothetical protein
MLIFSSLVLYIAPQWNIAYWTGWRVLGMHKAQWSTLHMNLGFVVLCAALFHIYLNWEHIARYVKSRAEQLLVPSRELAVALVLVVAVVVGTRYELPPMQWTTDLHRGFQYKVAARDGEPPIGYTELTPLDILTQRLDIDLEQALQQLENAGYPAQGPQTTILQIALANRVSPQTVYHAMIGTEGVALAQGGAGASP